MDTRVLSDPLFQQIVGVNQRLLALRLEMDGSFPASAVEIAVYDEYNTAPLKDGDCHEYLERVKNTLRDLCGR